MVFARPFGELLVFYYMLSGKGNQGQEIGPLKMPYESRERALQHARQMEKDVSVSSFILVDTSSQKIVRQRGSVAKLMAAAFDDQIYNEVEASPTSHNKAYRILAESSRFLGNQYVLV